MLRIVNLIPLVSVLALAGCSEQDLHGASAAPSKSKIVGTSYEAMAGLAAVFRENSDGSVEMCVWEVRTSQSQGCTTLQ